MTVFTEAYTAFGENSNPAHCSGQRVGALGRGVSGGGGSIDRGRERVEGMRNRNGGGGVGGRGREQHQAL